MSERPLPPAHDRAQVRRARVRATWSPPEGPAPRGDAGDPRLRPNEDESLDALAGDWRIFQRRDGHRYSTDDLLTAWFGVHVLERLGREATRCLDLGAGIGSVALCVAWALPRARVVGVEAQPLSAGLFERSIQWNGAEARVSCRSGDLRDVAALGDLQGICDLVTGSPPYLPPGRGTPSVRPQCDPCRFERRGGVEAYARAAAFALAPQGVFCLVHEHRAHARVVEAGRAEGLALQGRRTIVFREGREPLIAVYAFAHAGAEPLAEEAPLVIRDASGHRGPAYRAARARMGFPP